LSSKPNPSSLCPLFPFLLRIVHLVHLFLSLNLPPSVSCVPEEFSAGALWILASTWAMFRTFLGWWMLCVLLVEAVALKSKQARAKPTTKPSVSLSFDMSLRTATGTVQMVNADASRLAIASFETAMGLDGVAQSGIAHDGIVLDFARGRSFTHERFFGETVCYMTDLDIGMQPGVNTSSSALAKHAFRAAVGEILGAPIELYDAAEEYGGIMEMVSRECFLWSARQTSRMWFPSGSNASSADLSALGVGEKTSMTLRAALRNRSLSGTVMEGGDVEFGINATFCVDNSGEILAANSSRWLAFEAMNDNFSAGAVVERSTLWEELRSSKAINAPKRMPNAAALNADRGVAGGHCVDLTRGSVGPSELQAGLNDAGRIARINTEAAGHWEAVAYDVWEGIVVQEVVSALGTEIRPLRLPLRSSLESHLLDPVGGLLFGSASGRLPPTSFDARKRWPDCPSLGTVRNQGMCGSCWAFAAVTVLADRFCIAASEAGSENSVAGNASWAAGLALAPEHLVDCDTKNSGCQGGRLDDVWWYLRDHGVPLESCRPYRYCPMPTKRRCAYKGQVSSSQQVDVGAFAQQGGDAGACMGACVGGAPMRLYHASITYAVSTPGDVLSMQRELLAHGPMEVSFFVFSDFHNYRRGVYFRTPGAYGPLGGHAVRLLGWGTTTADYWVLANSWSPKWGLGGFFRIRRGTNECGIESMPAAGLPSLQ